MVVNQPAAAAAASLHNQYCLHPHRSALLPSHSSNVQEPSAYIKHNCMLTASASL